MECVMSHVKILSIKMYFFCLEMWKRIEHHFALKTCGPSFDRVMAPCIPRYMYFSTLIHAAMNERWAHIYLFKPQTNIVVPL